MKYKDLENKIDKIAKIEEPEECQKAVKELDQELKTPTFFFTAVERGNYVYFYKRYTGKRPIALGKMAIKDFKVFNENNWKELPEDELKRFLTPIR